MNNKNLPDILMGLSAIAIVLAAYDFLTNSDVISLAGTQWILIAIVLAIYGLYAKMRMA